MDLSTSSSNLSVLGYSSGAACHVRRTNGSRSKSINPSSEAPAPSSLHLVTVEKRTGPFKVWAFVASKFGGTSEIVWRRRWRTNRVIIMLVTVQLYV